ncbi:hypothetical protein Cme02nite_20600 [Catellatospora methionotrophica]|uniref:Septum formation-related domain-containing protein n=1 Tax=Catellatospora methionotrophica TaxID=121620 RepID=A0A8J3PEV7_9ACTN|nr:DUF4190 domain-containing protein [Catellatospora methionotrophica]GIG13728.1 hypothetical protein Cme02nite_20600 [Catellatospora methionotrophica]
MNYPSPDSTPPPYGQQPYPQVPPPPGAPQSGPPADPYAPYGSAPQYGTGQQQYGTGPQYAASQPYSAPPQQTPPGGYGVPYQQGPPPPSGTNGFAIASLIFGVLGGILFGFIFGFVALSQIKKRNQNGRGMAIAGIVLSSLWTLAICAGVAIAVIAGANADTTDTTGGDDTSVHSLRIGDCLNDLSTEDEIEELPVVPCTELHDGEVYAEFKLTESTFPGIEAIEKKADPRCADLLKSYAPKAVDDPAVDTYYLYPTSESWAGGDRAVTCIATFDPARTGKLKG